MCHTLMKESNSKDVREENTEAAASEVVTASTTNSVRTLIKPPLPFSPQMSRPVSVLSKVASRGLRLFEMSRAKSTSAEGGSLIVTSPSVVLMSPKPEADNRTTGPNETDLTTTPTQVQIQVKDLNSRPFMLTFCWQRQDFLTFCPQTFKIH